MEGDNGDRSKVLAYHSVLYARIPRSYTRESGHLTEGEKATTVREPDNEYDRCAVAVLQETCCVVRHTINLEIFELKNFIRKIFVLKKIRSYDGLRKYFNTIFLTPGRREAGMEELERLCCIRGIKKYGRQLLEKY